jgi:ParB/RepB/Spo0J family partition protein
MDSSSRPLDIAWISADLIAPNPWNPNRLAPDKRRKLRDEIQRRGFTAPILVRPHNGRFEIVDGEHRFRIARELGLKRLPCVALALSDTEARLKTLQMNGFRGENEPDRLAALLSELGRELEPEALARLLPWSAFELEELISLADQEKVDAAVRAIAVAPPVPVPQVELFTAVVSPAQLEIIEAALARARRNLKTAAPGEALAEVCETYLSARG